MRAASRSVRPEMVTGILLAGGRGDRLAAGAAKALVLLDGRPLFTHALARMAPVVEALVLVVPAEAQEEFGRVLAGVRVEPRMTVVTGGVRRQDSVRLGLAAVPDAAEVVVVHDAARPLASTDLMRATARAAGECRAAVAAVPARDTIKRVSEEGWVVDTPRREDFWLVQTPQAFAVALLREAHRAAEREGWSASDDAALVERLGVRVRIVPGEETNLKITTPSDLRVAEGCLRAG